MSTESVQTVLARAMREPTFAELLASDPDQALAGYDLTSDEITTLRGMSRAEFSALSTEARQSFMSFPSNGTNHNETGLWLWKGEQ